MAENSISTIIGLPFLLHRLVHGSDASVYTTEELPPALVHLSPIERPAVLVPTGFLRFTHPARPLPPGEVRPVSQYPGPSFPRCITSPPQILSSIKDIYLYSTCPPSLLLPVQLVANLFSLSSSAHPLRTPGTVASRRLAFSKVGRNHQTSSSHCVLPSTVPPG